MKRVIACLAPAARALLVLVALSAIAPSHLQALALGPGGSMSKPGTVPPLFPPYYTAGGVPANYSAVVASTLFPYNYNGTPNGAFFGEVLSRVWMDPISGALAFSYQFDNRNIGPATDIVRITIDDQTHPWTGIGILDEGADGSGSSSPQGPGPFWANGDPYLIERDGLFSGLATEFRVGGRGTELFSTTNDFSSTIWFATDATHFGRTNVALLDGGIAGTATAYAPAVPEPESLLLLAVGSMIGFVRLRRDQRRAG